MAWPPNHAQEGQQVFLDQVMQWFHQVPVFDISREALLSVPLPPIPFAPRSSTAIHASTYRLAWGELRLWDTFAGEVTNYWERLPQTDKTALVYTQALYHGNAQRVTRTIGPPTNEGDVKDRQGTFVPDIHNYAAVGLDNAPMPSDSHSSMAHINPGGHTNLTVDGCPDFVFSRTRNDPYYAAWDPYTILGEVKCPWLVTPARIDRVLDTINPQGFHFLFTFMSLLTATQSIPLLAIRHSWRLSRYSGTWSEMLVHTGSFRRLKDGVFCGVIMAVFSK